MNLAILGSDTEILRLAQAAVRQGYRLVWLGDIRSQEAASVRGLAHHVVDWAAEWEMLLDRAVADAVLVGRGDADGETRAEQLKRLATEAVPLLTSHPVVDSVLTCYELDMIRRETGGILRHYNPIASHPVIADLSNWVRSGHPELGPIHQFTCERHIGDTRRKRVLTCLARDVELIMAAAGNIRRVNAIGPAANDTSFASLQVQMTCDCPASLRWSVGPKSQLGESLEMKLVGDQGVLVVSVDDDARSSTPTWRLETTVSGQREPQLLEPCDSPMIAIERFAAAAAVDANGRTDASTWDAATRAMEVVDAVKLSLEKGRSIDVFQQQLTEQLAFRGAMAAFGCGLLMLGFVVIVVVTLIGGAEVAAGQRLVSFWPVALLAVLAFFLLLQGVPLLASKSKKRPPS